MACQTGHHRIYASASGTTGKIGVTIGGNRFCGVSEQARHKLSFTVTEQG